jgi:hypothetical protein
VGHSKNLKKKVLGTASRTVLISASKIRKQRPERERCGMDTRADDANGPDQQLGICERMGLNYIIFLRLAKNCKTTSKRGAN